MSGWNKFEVDRNECYEYVRRISNHTKDKDHMICVVMNIKSNNVEEEVMRLRELSPLFHIVLVLPNGVSDEKLERKCLLFGGTYIVPEDKLEECLKIYKPTFFARGGAAQENRNEALSRANKAKILNPSELTEIETSYNLIPVPDLLNGGPNPEYLDVKDKVERFYNMLQPNTNFRVRLIVSKIEKLSNPVWEKRFWSRYAQLAEPGDPSAKGTIQYFHGTTQQNYEKILKGGFRLPEAKPDHWFGPGIYAANDTTYISLFWNSFSPD